MPLLPARGWPLAVVLGAATAMACWICSVAEKALGRHDDPRIVLDEVVGFWFAAALLPQTATSWAAAFVLFRAFDSLKLPPYSWLERLPGGIGVVADDVGAGLVANAGVRILMHLGIIS